ncbi:MAG: hypothetical protein K2P41_03935 [Lachnospiraceae bacterium]|nr:hypothetical protein [Lachnospiraceae bacterium]
MFAFILLAGILVIIYFLVLLVVKILMLCNNCSEEDAKKMFASWWQENTSGQSKAAADLQKAGYELSGDWNYRSAVNSEVEKILGASRYDELCKLDEYSNTLQFIDNHSGYPTVQVTVNCNDKIEGNRLRRILENTTRQYILNYGDSANAKVLSYWSKNLTLHLPMIVIMYSRDAKEKQMLDRVHQSYIHKIARTCATRQRTF